MLSRVSTNQPVFHLGLERSFSDISNVITGKKSKLASVLKGCDNLQSQLKLVEDSNSLLEGQLESGRRSVIELKEIEHYHKDLRDAELTKYEWMAEKRSMYDTKLKELRNAIRSELFAFTDSKSKLVNELNKMFSLLLRHKSGQSINDYLEKEYQATLEELSALEASVSSNPNEEMEEIETELVKLQDILKEYQGEVSSLTQQNVSLNDEIEMLRCELEVADTIPCGH